MSRRSVLRAGGLAGAGLAGAALIGCGEDDPAPATPGPQGGAVTPTPAAATAEEDSRRGGTFSQSSPIPNDNFNPVTNAWEGYQLAGEQVYDRPISSRPDERRYVLEAAESIEQPDATTVVMRLKEGMVYQDRPPVNGRAVEADDIVRLHLYTRDEDQAHSRAFQTAFMDTVEAPDDRTVVFTLKSPSAYLFSPEQLDYPGANAIVPRELQDDLNTSEPIGSGPFQQVSYQFATRYEYERNPTYRRANEGMPFVDRRVRIPMADAAALEAAFRGKQNMVWQNTPVDPAQRLMRDLANEIEVEDYASLAPYTINVSSKRPKYDDIRVREAFYRMFRPEPFIELVAVGRAEPAPGYVPVSLPQYLIDWDDSLANGLTVREAKRYDAEESHKLFEAAGWDFNQTIELTTIAGAVNETALQVLDQELRAHGMPNISYKGVAPLGEWLTAISNTGDYDFCITGHPPQSVPAWTLRMHHSNTGYLHNSFNISDPEIDAMIEAAESEIDAETHFQLVKDVQYKLLEKYAHKWYIYSSRAFELRYDFVKDWEFNPALQVMQRPEMWLDL
jgi:peptide/nickel transport system substrate-binding protein